MLKGLKFDWSMVNISKGCRRKNVVFSNLFIAQQPQDQIEQIMCHFFRSVLSLCMDTNKYYVKFVVSEILAR